MSLIRKGVLLAAKTLISSIWSSSPRLLANIWSRSGPTRYRVARRHWTRSLKVSLILRTIFYVYWLLFICRLFLGVHFTTLPNGKQATYLEYDVMLYDFVYKQHLINFLSCLLCSGLFLFIVYLDYLMNIVHFNSAWGVMYELLNLNPQDFWKLNPNLMPNVDFQSRPIESARNCLQILRWLSKPPKALKAASFKVKELRYVNPNCTKVMRAQAVVLSTGLQVIFTGLLCIVVFFDTICWMYIYFFHLVPLSIRPSAYLFGLLDALVCLYTTINTARQLFLLGHGLVLVQFFAGRQIHRNFRFIHWSIRRFRARTMTVSQFSTNLTIMHQNFKLGLEEMINNNDAFVSRLILTGLGSQFLANIYVVTALSFIDFPPFYRLVLFIYIAVQIIVLGVVLPPLCRLANDMHSVHPLLVRIVPLLSSRTALRQKLKMMSFYEITNTDKKVAFTCGPLGEVSSRTVYEFLAFYVAQLLFIFELFAENLNNYSEYTK